MGVDDDNDVVLGRNAIWMVGVMVVVVVILVVDGRCISRYLPVLSQIAEAQQRQPYLNEIKVVKGDLATRRLTPIFSTAATRKLRRHTIPMAEDVMETAGQDRRKFSYSVLSSALL